LQRDSHMTKQLPLSVSKIVLTNREEDAVLRVLRSGRLVQGKETHAFEQEFARYVGSNYAVAVSNGTCALHLALLAVGLKPEDKVITTPFSFIASTNAILYVCAKPIFVDIGLDYNIDVSLIEKKITKKTRAILPVHLFGKPCAMDEIMKLAMKYNLAVIEDACQAHGAMIGKRKVGSLGDVGCFSFYATKNMATGEGGMVTTNSKKLYEFLRLARSHGSKERYYHDFLGYNYRMTDFQAALGLEQLKSLDQNNARRIRNAQYLNKGLDQIRGLITPVTTGDVKHVFHQYTIRITKEFPISRDTLADCLEKKGIGCSIIYPLPIHKQKQFLKMGYKLHLPIAEQTAKEVISLPVHPYLRKRDLDSIIEVIKNAVR
jgi:perosamine synthetase